MSDGRLPNLLIVGVPKAGTTSLYSYLSQHPAISGGEEKEPGYFNQFSRRRPTGKTPMTIEQYKRMFDGSGREPYTMEATPSYCYGGLPTIDAIRSSLPDPRIIISLRNPTDRLWSGYNFQRSKGNLSGIHSFAEYLAVCEERRADGTEVVSNDHLQGLATGFYAEYVPLWLRAFDDHLRVVFAEDLAREPLAVLRSLCEWLGIDPAAVDTLDLGTRNVTVPARSSRLAGTIYSLKRAGDRHGVLPRPLRERLRRAYLRVNAREPAEELSAEMRRRVDGIYEESNRETLRVLRQSGYDQLPAWLRDVDVRSGEGALSSG